MIQGLPYETLCEMKSPKDFVAYQKSTNITNLFQPYTTGLVPVWVAFQQNIPSFDPGIAEFKQLYVPHANTTDTFWTRAITQTEIGHSKTFGVSVCVNLNGLNLDLDLMHTRTSKPFLDWNNVYQTTFAGFSSSGTPTTLPEKGVVYANVHGGYAWIWAGRPPVN